MERVTIEQARVVAGVIEVKFGDDWLAAPDVILLSDGGDDSTGQVFIGETFALYVVNTQPDTQYLIDMVVELAEAVQSMTLLQVSRTPDLTPFDPAGTLTVQAIIAKLNNKALI